jgi:penicillin G amidase
MKFLKWTFAIIFIAILGLISVAFLYVQSSRPVYNGEVHTSQIKNGVKVLYDNYGIPHIYASSEKDAYFVLGYVHAQERLFQMEMLRRVGAGRLSEVLGSDMVKVDAFFRTLGIAKSAKESNALFFSKHTEQWQLDALSYLNGINSFIEQGPTPPEFIMLDIPKIKFTPEDFYLITGYMSFSFAEALRTDPLMDKIYRKYGKEYLYPFGMKNFPDADSSLKQQGDVAKLSVLTDKIIAALPFAPWLGSNAWTVSPFKSASGKVLLANDTHIGYQQPAVWFEAHLEYPGYNLYGNYLAGFPFPLIGHNKEAGWGLTMLLNDDMNLYREKVSNNKHGQYNYLGVWEKFATRSEVIHVKGKRDTTITVRETQHGPVINDVLDNLGESAEPVTLWWTYTRFPVTALQVTYNLSHATDVTDARQAAAMVNAPGLNIVYGDIKGNTGWYAAARMPVYSDSSNTKLILDGSSGKDDIKGYFDFEQNPMLENPVSGYLLSSNNAPDTSYGQKFPGYYAPPDRSDRIARLLNSQEKWSLNDLKKINTDVISDVQPANAAIILELIGSDSILNLTPVHERATSLLKSWNGNHRINDVGPTIYYKLLSYILEMAMIDETGEEDFNTLVNTHLMKSSYSRFLSDDNLPWWDDITTKDKIETRKEIFIKAYSLTISDLQASSGDQANWTWGSVHTLEHIHPIGRKEPFNKIFNVGPYQVPGGIETINNAGFPLSSKGKYPVSYGPAMRILIDFNDVSNALSILPTGQSGHIRSPYYHDQVRLYNTGKFRNMNMDKNYLEKRCTNILTFTVQ